VQSLDAFFVEPLDPFANGLRGCVKLPRNSRLAHATIHYSTNHEASTFRGQRSILVGVHSVLRESLWFGDFSVHGWGRMDNLLKAQI
jgi:hypothetical protein